MAPFSTTLDLNQSGTWTLEDDGVAGNGISRLRRPDGSSFLVEHPTNLLKFTASEPGVSLVFNLTESLGSARLAVGDLADSTVTPESIVLSRLESSNLITLVATGRITESVTAADAAPDVIAPSLIMSAGTGIGEDPITDATRRIDLQVGVLEAETGTGGIWLENQGDLVIGGLTSSVAGLDVATSGDIFLSNFGSIRFSDTSGPQVVHSGSSQGSVALLTWGTGASISSDVDNVAVVAPAGLVRLDSDAGDISLGGGAAGSLNNDVRGAYGVVLEAGGNVLLAGDSDIVANPFGLDLPFTSQALVAARNITIAGGASVAAADPNFGDVRLLTAVGGEIFLAAPGTAAVSASNVVYIQTDRFRMDPGSGVSTPNSIQFATTSNYRPIALVGGAEPANALGLSSVELNRMFTGSLIIGNEYSGPVTVQSVMDLATVSNLVLRSRDDIFINEVITGPSYVTLAAAGTVFQAPGASVSAGRLDIFVDAFGDYQGVGETLVLQPNPTAFPVRAFGGNDGDSLTGTNGREILLGEAGNDTLYGLGGNDDLYGGLGADFLDGGAGADAMFGLAGNDTMIVDDAGDVVFEAAGEGFDNVAASASYVLNSGAAVEVLSTTDNSGTAAINLIGNGFGQSVIGNNGGNYLDGGGGADLLQGRGGNDTIIVDADDVVMESVGGGSDTVAAKVSYVLTAGQEVEILSTTDNAGTAAIALTGNTFGQSVIGNAGNNYLDGGGGADMLIGLGGNDTMIVDAADVVIESAGGGFDTVAATASYVLTAGQEVEILSTTNNAGTAAIALTGNAFGQSLIGNAGNNYLDGGDGADVLVGLGGNDTLIVDAADAVVESAGGGVDTVAAKVSYILTAGQEVEVLSTTNNAGTAAIVLTGNGFGQSLIGNAGSNYLDGGGGADALVGLGGNDTMIVDSADDVVIEAVGGGSDTVAAKASYILTAGQEIELLSTTDNAGTAAINLIGNGFGQSVLGNAGANILNGEGGSDFLQGFGGADTFAFNSALGAGNIDTIADMLSGVDRISLDDAIFAGLALGTLSASAFRQGTAAQDADDRIIYNSATGALFFDADGNGAGTAIQFATLQAGLSLSASDFLVI